MWGSDICTLWESEGICTLKRFKLCPRFTNPGKCHVGAIHLASRGRGRFVWFEIIKELVPCIWKKKSISDSYKLKVEWKFGSKILIFVFINSNLLFARIHIDMTIRITLANEEKCTSDWRMLMGFAHLPWEGLWEFTWAVSKLAALIVGIHFSLEKRIASYFSLILKALGRTWRVFEMSWAPQAFPWCPGVATVSKRGSKRPACWFPRSFYAKWLARSAFTEVPHSSWGSQMQGDYLWKKHPTQTK